MNETETVKFNPSELIRIANDAAKIIKDSESSVIQVNLFGSLAKNEADPDSDIDIAIIILGQTGMSQEIKSRVSAKLTENGIKVGNGAGQVDIHCFAEKYLQNPDELHDVQRKVVRSIKSLNNVLA